MASYSTGMHHAEAEWELAGRAQGSLPDRIHLQIRQASESNTQGLPNYPQLLIGAEEAAPSWDKAEGQHLGG